LSVDIQLMNDGPTPNFSIAGRAVAATLLDRFRYNWQARRKDLSEDITPDIIDSCSALKCEGFSVLPNYYTVTQCEDARAEIDRLIREQPHNSQIFSGGADTRLYGAERASDAIAAFNDDRFPREVGEFYRGHQLKNMATLAGRLTAVPGNLGSGEGWHRDAFHFQYKSMTYLTDVVEDNGPFQMIVGSHRLLNIVRDTLRGRLDRPPSSRVTQAQIDRILNRNPKRLRTFTAPAGTLILFDSSTIHRGAPINAGVRYALTNYFYLPEQITPALREKFGPFVQAPAT
jgi:hypothetical protein